MQMERRTKCKGKEKEIKKILVLKGRKERKNTEARRQKKNRKINDRKGKDGRVKVKSQRNEGKEK